MRLLALTALAMACFAGNSILNRLAVGGGHIDPNAFAALRVAAGAAILLVLVMARRTRSGPTRPVQVGLRQRVTAVAGLGTYMLGFSAAYLQLDAGTGALVLFATVQVTMFCGALVGQEPVPRQRWLGAAMAMAGLILLLWPTGGNPAGAVPVLLMVLAGTGWGVYSLTGRKSADPLAETAANFALCLPVMLLPLLVWAPQADATGLVLAILSGAVTSGLGYALWFAVLPTLGAARGAVAQLGVPVLAMFGGAVLLGEAPSLIALAAALLVLSGVGVALRR